MSCFCFYLGKEEQPPVNTEIDQEGFENVKLYTYKEVKVATNDFCPSNKVGEGGFGSVYKGKLKDGTIVAVKVLSSESKQGAREFLNEINTISGIVHENLVSIFGCCIEGDHRILLYNYLENNSLAQTLLGGNQSNIQFNWRTRVKICSGVARGLAFLHEEIRPHIVHRDIKASNILLDKDLNPKISDFGLAKLLPPNMTHVSTRVAGTVGYLAPEYAVRGHLTRRADVYSFGVLLLEIVTGRNNTNTMLPSEYQFLLENSSDITQGILLMFTWLLHERGDLISVVDTYFNGDFDEQVACNFLKIALLCTQDNPKLRPKMSEVVKMLTGKRDVNMEKITKPGLISDFMELKIKRDSKDANKSAQSTSSGPDNSSSENTNTSFTEKV